MLVEDIVRRVRTSAGDITALQFSNDTLTDWINDAVRECVVEHSLLQSSATSATVIGQADYVLPTDIYRLHSVLYDGTKLKVLTREEWEQYYSSHGPVGNTPPVVAYQYAGVLTVYPTPDAAADLVIYYTKLPTEITYVAGVWTPDTPSINSAYHNRLVSYCLAQVALQDEDNYKYNMLMMEFKTGIKDVTVKNEDDLYPSISVSSRDCGDWYDF